jgi:hypothetical protein
MRQQFVIRTDSHESLLFQLRKGLTMKKLIAALVTGLFAVSVFAQTSTPSSTSGTPAASSASSADSSASPTKPGKKHSTAKKAKKSTDSSASASSTDAMTPPPAK